MSRSEITALATRDVAALAVAVSELVESTLNRTGVVDIDLGDARKLVSAVTRLYAVCSDSASRELRAIDATVATTDAVTLACALLRAGSRNPFDVALWFARAGVARPVGTDADDRPGAAS
jgi:hypothetical protein